MANTLSRCTAFEIHIKNLKKQHYMIALKTVEKYFLINTLNNTYTEKRIICVFARASY